MQVMMPILLKMTGGQIPGFDMNTPPTTSPSVVKPGVSSPSSSVTDDTKPVPESQNNCQPSPNNSETDEDELTPEEIEQRANRKKANKLRELGNAEFKSGKFEKALELYQQAHSIDTKNPVILNNIGAVFMKQKEYQKAKETMLKSAELCNDFDLGIDFETKAKTFHRLGRACHKLGELDEAIEYLDKSILNIRDRKVVRLLSDIKSQKKKQDAEAYINPEIALEQKAKGNKLFKEGQFFKAIEIYNDAIKRDPSNATIYSNRSLAYTRVGDFQKALADINKALSIDSKFVNGYAKKARLQIALKQFTQARDTISAGLALAPYHKGLLQCQAEVQQSIYASTTGDQSDEQQRQEALKDPKVRKLLENPMTQKILEDLKNNPQAAQEHMKNPEVINMLETLAAAGFLKLGPGP